MTSITDGKLHNKFLVAILKYDTQERRKPSYNLFAHDLIVKRLAQVEGDIANGASVRESLVNGFCGRLLDRLLRVAGLPKSTDDEQRFKGGFTTLTIQLDSPDYSPRKTLLHARHHLYESRVTPHGLLIPDADMMAIDLINNARRQLDDCYQPA